MSIKQYWKHGLLTIALLAIIGFTFSAAMADMADYYVSPTGNDGNDGLSPETAVLTIQQALLRAQPGDIVHLAAGDYYQDIVSVRNGSSNAPITLTGPKDAVIRGGGNGRIFEINHDYLTLDGFTLDGLHGDPASASGYRDKLLYVHGQQIRRGVVGLRVLNMTFANAGGECVRLRYFVQNSEIANSTFRNCGVHDFLFNAGGKNGEGIYMGTSSNQWNDGKNPTADPDETSNNWIHDNLIVTQGNECVEVKEGASGNIIEHNDCSGQRDPNSGGFGLRGSGNILRYNRSYGNVGAGVRIGGHEVGGILYGQENDVYGNEIFGNQAGGIKFQVDNQGMVCGNLMADNNGGDNVGRYGDLYTAAAPCSDAEPPTTPTAASEPPQGGITVTASSDDGNVPENTLDKRLDTRWSTQGDGEWITYNLGAVKMVESIRIAFHQGTQRVAFFDIEVSEDGARWTQVLAGESNGLTDDLQTFNLTPVAAQYVRFVGYGNSSNNWNGLTEVEILASDGNVAVTPEATAVSDPTATPEPTNTPEPVSVYQLEPGNNWIEAEAHTNSNVGNWMQAEDAYASNNRFMLLSASRDDRGNPNDVLEYTFNLNYEGNIYVWYRGIRAPNSRHGVYIQLDNGRLNRADLLGDKWSWYLDDNTREWIITPGTHTLRFYNRFEGSQLDRILITTDPNFIPVGQGEVVALP
ncbi:MAG: discoidin domain-containing protein [Ardenticatenaceae bacterium]|nr:discoidin domain-containing protein [Ardenticatenaceae bacterium]